MALQRQGERARREETETAPPPPPTEAAGEANSHRRPAAEAGCRGWGRGDEAFVFLGPVQAWEDENVLEMETGDDCVTMLTDRPGGGEQGQRRSAALRRAGHACGVGACGEDQPHLVASRSSAKNGAR